MKSPSVTVRSVAGMLVACTFRGYQVVRALIPRFYIAVPGCVLLCFLGGDGIVHSLAHPSPALSFFQFLIASVFTCVLAVFWQKQVFRCPA